jgi:antitoxin component YwqK of YwqJK toxin-antitoxin module
MRHRAARILAIALTGAWLAMPPALEAQQPTLARRRPSGAPALLSAPAVNQAAPLVPDDAAAAAQPPAQTSNKRLSSRRQQPSGASKPRPAESAPPSQKLVPEPVKLEPEPTESNPQSSAAAGQPDDESSTRQGQWTQWEDGRALWTCEFRAGVRHGKATRYFVQGEGPLFAESRAEGFEAPFQARAVFVQGKLDGICTIVDNSNRTLCQLSLKADELEGESVWFYPSGERREVVHYQAGRLEGQRLEYGRDGQLAKDENYLGGRPTATETTFYEPGRKQMRGSYYLAAPLTSTRFDWLQGDLPISIVKDYPSDVRTGKWTWWHPNGQPQLEGHYEEDAPTGTFTWWHPNGQKQRQGSYVDGSQSGKWNWWYPTGQKQIEGIYLAGEATGQWQFWGEDGARIRGDAATLAAHSSQQKPPSQAPRTKIIRQAQPRQNPVR